MEHGGSGGSEDEATHLNSGGLEVVGPPWTCSWGARG